jgi:hypothetical protein
MHSTTDMGKYVTTVRGSMLQELGKYATAVRENMPQQLWEEYYKLGEVCYKS